MHFQQKQCSMRSAVTDTDLGLIEFPLLLGDEQFNRFSYILPPSIGLVSEDVQSEDPKIQETLLKKKKKEASKYEKNENLVNDWKLRNNETWGTVFSHKASEGPALSVGCKPCLKFHVKGGCFSDCKLRRSHCVLANKDKSKIEAYIKLLQGE